MRTHFTVLLVVACGLMLMPGAAQQRNPQTLRIYFIDTEGGQSTLFVAPSGEAALVDAGNPGGRDTDRIELALKDAGVTQIDHMIITHYHGDHIAVSRLSPAACRSSISTITAIPSIHANRRLVSRRGTARTMHRTTSRTPW